MIDLPQQQGGFGMDEHKSSWKKNYEADREDL